MTARDATIEAAKILKQMPRCDVRKLRAIADASGIDVPRLFHLAHRFLRSLRGG